MILSFAIDDDDEMGIKSFILMRTPRYERLYSRNEWRGQVSMEGSDYYENNLLGKLKIEGNVIEISAH